MNDLYLFSYPFYHHFNLKTSFENINLFTLNSNNELIKSKSLHNFNYIIKGNSANKKNEFTFTMKYIQGNNNFVRQYKLKPFELPPGDELIKLYMYNYLTDKKNKLSEDDRIKLAIKYQIFIEETSLFAEAELSEKISTPMISNYNQ